METDEKPSGGQLHPRLAAVAGIAPGLAATIGGACEVVVHDLSKVPDSVVAIAGGLTGGTVGGPAADLLISAVSKGAADDLVNYRTETADGRLMRSSAIFVRDADGVAIGCLCVTIDVTSWAGLADIAAWNLGTDGAQGGAPAARAVDGDGWRRARPGLRAALVARAIEDAAVPVGLMQKHHKMRVVQALDADGFFLIKGSVGFLAHALNVTRYSIYNYLSEIRETEASDGDQGAAQA